MYNYTEITSSLLCTKTGLLVILYGKGIKKTNLQGEKQFFIAWVWENTLWQ